MLRKKTYVNLTTTPAPPLFCSSRRGCHFLQPTSPAQTLVHLLSNAQWEQWLVEINLLDWRRVVKRKKKGKDKKKCHQDSSFWRLNFSYCCNLLCIYIYIYAYTVSMTWLGMESVLWIFCLHRIQSFLLRTGSGLERQFFFCNVWPLGPGLSRSWPWVSTTNQRDTSQSKRLMGLPPRY